MIGKLSSGAAGALLGVLFSLYYSIPFAVKVINDQWPVYSKPTDIIVEEHDGKLLFSATVKKMQNCEVIPGKAYAALEWQSPYGTQKRIVPTYTPTHERHLVGPLYVKGDTMRLSDRQIDISSVAEADMIRSFHLLFPCRRLGGHEVVAEIGPFPVE